MEALDPNIESSETDVHAPKGLRIVCVIAWLTSLMTIALTLGLMIGGQVFIRWARFPVLDTFIRDDFHGNALYMILKILLTLASCFAVFQIWMLRKSGFWTYVAAEGLLLLLPLMFLSTLGGMYLLVKLLIALIFTLLLIFLFSFYFKKLK